MPMSDSIPALFLSTVAYCGKIAQRRSDRSWPESLYHCSYVVLNHVSYTRHNALPPHARTWQAIALFQKENSCSNLTSYVLHQCKWIHYFLWGGRICEEFTLVYNKSLTVVRHVPVCSDIGVHLSGSLSSASTTTSAAWWRSRTASNATSRSYHPVTEYEGCAASSSRDTPSTTPPDASTSLPSDPKTTGLPCE